MANLNGKWIYRSFRPNDGTPSLLPWAPPGELSVTTDAAGKVSGKLTFPAVPGLELMIGGSIAAAVAGNVRSAWRLTRSNRCTKRSTGDRVTTSRPGLAACRQGPCCRLQPGPPSHDGTCRHSRGGPRRQAALRGPPLWSPAACRARRPLGAGIDATQ